jgi:hypothetical protein
MKRTLIFATAFVFASLFVAGGAWAFGVKDVVQMHQDGIADSLIIMKILHSEKQFHLEADDMRDLKKAGVSDEVVSAMLATEGQKDGGYESAPYGYAPYGYAPYGYSYYPYYPYYPRVVVGLGFGYYGGYGHYGHYGHYAPYYRGYYGGGHYVSHAPPHRGYAPPGHAPGPGPGPGPGRRYR